MYTIYFVDGSTFKGGDYKDSKWNEMPDKAIKRIDYYIGNKAFRMEGYKSYNLLFEKAYILNQSVKFTKIFLMAMNNKGKVTSIILDIRKQQVSREITEYGKEYKGRSTTGWKKGVENKEGKVYVSK